MVTAVTTTVAIPVLAVATATAAVTAIPAAVVVVVVTTVTGVAATLVAVVALATVVGAAVVVAGDILDRGSARMKLKTSRVVLATAFEGDGMGVEFSQGHDVDASRDGSDEGLVLAVEPGDEGGDDVLLAHGTARGGELICIGADLGEVVHHGEVALAEVHHVHLDLHHAGAAVRDVHLLEVRPDGTGGVEEVDLLKHIVGERGEQVAQDDLILTGPGSILRVRSAPPLSSAGRMRGGVGWCHRHSQVTPVIRRGGRICAF